jgi:hypothetical protein
MRPVPPTGDWWRKRGVSCYEKKVFYRAKETVIACPVEYRL